MDRIKFRAYVSKESRFKLPIGMLESETLKTMLNNKFTGIPAWWTWEDTGLIFMQWTGFKDCKGVDIYEGDIIEFDKREWGGDDNIHAVSWDEEEGAWCWGGGSSADMEWRTVIGNIYEHPNLVEQLFLTSI